MPVPSGSSASDGRAWRWIARRGLSRIAFALGLAAALSGAAPAPDVTQIRFPPGATGTTISGGVPRGSVAVYAIGAQRGQRMAVRIASVEHNAVFQLYRPGAQVTVADGLTTVTGRALPGAGEGEDATAWSGTLPASGDYLVVVGATRGGAAYSLSVSLKRPPG